MNTVEVKRNNKNVVLGPHFFSSHSINKFRSILDTKSQNTIIMVNLDRATVYEAKDFSDFVESIIEKGNVKIILDLETVYFMDSVFFGTMVKLFKTVNKQNGYIKLIFNADKKPEFFTLKTFHGIFATYSNLFEALNSPK
jgi:anti-anti-sigma factor